MEKVKEKLKDEKVKLGILFLAATVFFLYQRYFTLSWDFTAYFLNAKYFFGNGEYLEVVRPPLVPSIIGLFLFLGKGAKYVYVTVASAVFLFSTKKLAESIDFKPSYFYAISLNPYLMHFGLINGTELLFLSLLEVTIALILQKKDFGGLTLGLAVLARYNAAAFLPLLLFYREKKKIAKNFIYFGLAILPWLVYNKIKFGNFITSIADSYTQNIAFRSYLFQPIDPKHLLIAFNFLLPLIVLGLVRFLKNMSLEGLRNPTSLVEKNEKDLLMLLTLIISFYSYYKTPLKFARYLFPSILPAAYFSYRAIDSLDSRKLKIGTVGFLLATNLVLFIPIPKTVSSYDANPYHTGNTPVEKYRESIATLREKNLQNCTTKSNDWVRMNYFGKITEPYPTKKLIDYYIGQGEQIVLFKRTPPNYATNTTSLKKFPIIKNKSKYIILGNSSTCEPESRYNKTYLQSIAKKEKLISNTTIKTDYCDIMLPKPANKACKYINKKFRWLEGY